MGKFFNDRNSDRRGGGRTERATMHKAVCDDCGQDCEVPFRPSGNKPIYCSRCFENVDPKRGARSSSNSPKMQASSVDISPITQQLITLNTKLDMLISVLGEKKVVKKEETEKKEKKTKVKAKK